MLGVYIFLAHDFLSSHRRDQQQGVDLRVSTLSLVHEPIAMLWARLGLCHLIHLPSEYLFLLMNFAGTFEQPS